MLLRRGSVMRRLRRRARRVAAPDHRAHARRAPHPHVVARGHARDGWATLPDWSLTRDERERAPPAHRLAARRRGLKVRRPTAGRGIVWPARTVTWRRFGKSATSITPRWTLTCGAVAAVGRLPPRAPHRRRRVAARRAELGLAVAPQLADGRRRCDTAPPRGSLARTLNSPLASCSSTTASCPVGAGAARTPPSRRRRR